MKKNSKVIGSGQKQLKDWKSDPAFWSSMIVDLSFESGGPSGEVSFSYEGPTSASGKDLAASFSAEYWTSESVFEAVFSMLSAMHGPDPYGGSLPITCPDVGPVSPGKDEEVKLTIGE